MSTIDHDQLQHITGGARVYMKSPNDWQLQLGLQTLRSSIDSIASSSNQQNQNLALMMIPLLMMRR